MFGQAEVRDQDVQIAARTAILKGDLALPSNAPGVVLFAHGSGSSRHSPRNQFVARIIREAGIGTLLFDLLTPEEELLDARTGHLRFDIELLAERLVYATKWINKELDHVGVGYFGSSTGGGAALVAAAELGGGVGAVVSRGGRPDLAGDALSLVECPTLLIVGGLDYPVIRMNQDAFSRLQCEKELRVVPGASHLFEEPGKLEQVAALAANWFREYLQVEVRSEGSRSDAMIYLNRSEAGKHLAKQLLSYANRDDVVVLALPRGGVPVAFEVAKGLRAPLDIFLVRKLGVPGHEELAMGAIASGGVRVLNQDVVDYLQIPKAAIDAVAAKELTELKRREVAYRGNQPEPNVQGKIVILVDDGLATGSTMRAASGALRKQNPARIVVAVPVSAAHTCDEYRMGVDEIVCGMTPEPFYGVGRWYQDFSQTSDIEVRTLLEMARASSSGHPKAFAHSL